MNDDLNLVFKVPNEDFDFTQADVGLRGMEELHRERHANPRIWMGDYDQNVRLRAAYDTLHVVHSRYAELVGHPEWKRPKLEWRA